MKRNDTIVRCGNAANGNGARGRFAITERGSFSPGACFSGGESPLGGGFGFDL
jgi:hypothetical protein